HTRQRTRRVLVPFGRRWRQAESCHIRTMRQLPRTGAKTMKFLMYLLALGVLAASPALADNAVARKPLPAQSVRTAQNLCLKRGQECCCERVGPLCCEGLQCVIKGSR